MLRYFSKTSPALLALRTLRFNMLCNNMSIQTVVSLVMKESNATCFSYWIALSCKEKDQRCQTCTAFESSLAIPIPSLYPKFLFKKTPLSKLSQRSKNRFERKGNRTLPLVSRSLSAVAFRDQCLSSLRCVPFMWLLSHMWLFSSPHLH